MSILSVCVPAIRGEVISGKAFAARSLFFSLESEMMYHYGVRCEVES